MKKQSNKQLKAVFALTVVGVISYALGALGTMMHSEIMHFFSELFK